MSLPTIVIPADRREGRDPTAPPTWVPAFPRHKAGASRDDNRSVGFALYAFHHVHMRRAFHSCVYILASKRNGTLYTGVTGNLIERMRRHLTATRGFCVEYNVRRLMYFEELERIEQAILREKRIKRWRRAWKLALIEGVNPDWADLWPALEAGTFDYDLLLPAPSRGDRKP